MTTPISTWANPNCTQNVGEDYTDVLESAFRVMQRFSNNFAPHEQSSPNMTIRIEAGSVFNSFTLTEVAAQNTGTITAPMGNPRIDRIVVNMATGAVTVITGTPAGSPTPPALIAGTYPIAQVLLQTSSTSITNSMITDERNFVIKGRKAIADRQVFNSSGTWTKPSGLGANSQAFVQVWGAGGSGASDTLRMGGGGGGSYKEAWFLASVLGSTETITIGSGGSGVTGVNDGNSGTASSFGSWLAGYGGGGGGKENFVGYGPGGAGGGWFANSALSTIDVVTGEGIGGTNASNAPSSGFYVGGGGGTGIGGGTSKVGANSVFAGGGGGGASTLGGGDSKAGGSSIYGGAGGAGSFTTNGTAGTQPGGGGGACVSTATSGAGGNGRVIVTVFNG